MAWQRRAVPVGVADRVKRRPHSGSSGRTFRRADADIESSASLNGVSGPTRPSGDFSARASPSTVPSPRAHVLTAASSAPSSCTIGTDRRSLIPHACTAAEMNGPHAPAGGAISASSIGTARSETAVPISSTAPSVIAARAGIPINCKAHAGWERSAGPCWLIVKVAAHGSRKGSANRRQQVEGAGGTRKWRG